MYQPILVLALAGWARAQYADVQTFGSGNFNGAAESHHTRPDGVTEGECAYFNGQGQEVKVRYEELGGVLQSIKSSVPSGNAETQLAQCRAAAAQIHQNLLSQQQNLFSNLPFMAGILPAAFPGAGAAGSFAGAFAGGQNGGFTTVGGTLGNGLPQTDAFGVPQQGKGGLQGTPNIDVLNVRRVNTGVVPGGSTGSASNYDGVYSSSGVSISNVIGSDGVSHSQCSYTDGNGDIIKINIAESPSGQTDVEVLKGNPLKSNEYFTECQRLSEEANQQARLAQAQAQDQARRAQQQADEAQKQAQEQIRQQTQQIFYNLPPVTSRASRQSQFLFHRPIRQTPFKSSRVTRQSQYVTPNIESNYFPYMNIPKILNDDWISGLPTQACNFQGVNIAMVTIVFATRFLH